MPHAGSVMMQVGVQAADVGSFLFWVTHHCFRLPLMNKLGEPASKGV